LLGPILATSLNLSLASVFPLQGLGYTAEDSAGQSNIFAVEPKTYVAGSAKDPKAGSGSFVYAMTAGVIGAAAIAAGVSLTAQESRTFFSFLSFFPHRARLPSACTLSLTSMPSSSLFSHHHSQRKRAARSRP
jgi:hypothetical protein